ncbi:ABC transporter permease [Bradyrhizobium sp. U87765 SZCCT0131]|uniref:ABC transporter permease n=1 Tax=unclassified Bradyrhizobium TaxID=2631580 RepID=UPI001BA800A5|nr:MULTISPECIES: ABC transporter permease [unclassified Bradyrhizobium]MBR1221509.1 ABC transporter permease [Bradyrhizobium sp. U87765 SZCCT0131]MBR1264568.1 ABC transporter permease [Bradyrhizobium sp. U87765 SZCCT0134]MBR1304526.1 ABC transporter permease [Bradyrhizobium sp. U87765 SZCCT0110]MBR1322617.1 ABC transporter permease [Bradyrhizobium sp. U87765 SZCCT0109]MBR1346455.1 ABC transporter permease [Bradyrhizobium sp. U87765 SZCCT0048]
MTSYFLLKLLRLAIVLLVVAAASFLLLNLLPGDVALALLGNEATPEAVAQVHADLGLDQPLLLRYLHWLAGFMHGDLGRSYITQVPVMESILDRLPVTIELMLLSQGLALLIAIPSGVLCAYRAGSRIDQFTNAVALLLLAAPVFIIAILLMFLFALKLRWLPSTGYVPFMTDPVRNLAHLALPALAIALAEWPPLFAVLRADMIKTLQQDYIALAKAKGLGPTFILLRHALRPSSFTLVTISGLQIAATIAGALVVETIFGLPGIGRMLTGAVYNRDMMLVQGCVAAISVGYVLINFGVDLIYALLDPRVRQ